MPRQTPLKVKVNYAPIDVTADITGAASITGIQRPSNVNIRDADNMVKIGGTAPMAAASGGGDDPPPKDKPGFLSKIWGGLSSAAGSDWMNLGLRAIGEMYENRAIMAEAAESARVQRYQGRQVVEQASRQARDVREEESFRSTEEARQLRNTGFLTGSESFAQGTGVGSVFEANRKEAEALAGDIMSEARKQKEQYDLAADAGMKAAKERTKGNVLGRIAKNIPILKDL